MDEVFAIKDDEINYDKVMMGVQSISHPDLRSVPCNTSCDKAHQGIITAPNERNITHI